MQRKLVSALPWLIITVALAIIATSSWDDSPDYDECELMVSGYMCVTKSHFWLNVYHPPLVKDMAGAAMCAANPGMDYLNWFTYKHYRRKIVDDFLWTQDAQKLLRLARSPMIALSILFLAVYYLCVRKEFGFQTALVALTMMAMSPTFLAHSRFVCTDAPATAFFFFCIFAFLNYVRKPRWSAVFILGTLTGVALLAKFSLLVLIPIYAFLTLIWVLVKPRATRFRDLPWKKYSLQAATALTLIFAVLYCGYALNMRNLSHYFQQWYNGKHFRPYRSDPRLQIVLITRDIPVLRPISWYLTGLLAQAQHVELGHDRAGYLLGKLYRGGQTMYFPILLVTKEPAGFVILELVAVLSALAGAVHALRLLRQNAGSSEEKKSQVAQLLQTGSTYIHQNFVVFSSLTFIVVYLGIAMSSKLNLGIRHVMPILPFAYMLTAVAITRLPIQKAKRTWIIAVCLGAGVISSSLAYPGYLSYWSEFVGGKVGGRRIAIDHNCDWGIDLYRLKKYCDKNQINFINIAYYGTANPEYYFGKSHVKYWRMDKPIPSGQYLAVSVHFVQQIKALEAANLWPSQARWLGQKTASRKTLRWFTGLKPIATAGDSILIYKVP